MRDKHHMGNRVSPWSVMLLLPAAEWIRGTGRAEHLIQLAGAFIAANELLASD